MVGTFWPFALAMADAIAMKSGWFGSMPRPATPRLLEACFEPPSDLSDVDFLYLFEVVLAWLEYGNMPSAFIRELYD